MSQTDSPKIGWIPLEEYGNVYEHRFCEAPRHRGTFTRAVKVVALSEPGAQDQILGVCPECWGMFDRDIGEDWRL